MAQAKGVSLTQVHPPADATENTDVDIIAIHGLDTKSPETWTWRSPSNPKELVNWLREPNMLPSKVGPARIYTCDWPADLFQSSDTSPMVLDEFAELLLAAIRRRPLATKDGVGEDRPILFIASCLGGIILMKALVLDDKHIGAVRRATRGIVFLATPFRGTAFQDVADWAIPILKSWAAVQDKAVKMQLLDYLKGPNFDLGVLVRSFTALVKDKEAFQLASFYEKRKTVLYHRIPLASLLPPWFPRTKLLVDESSAILDIDTNPLPLDRYHVTMNKFYSPDDPAYVCVAGKIEESLRYIRTNSLLQRADSLLRKQHYTKDKLKIERLSGDPLPMDQCYINLAIVENSGRAAGLSKENNQSSPFSLFARQKVETPDKTSHIELATVFNKRKVSDGHEIQPRRILIRGRAGVGKTTLCRKIVHDFTHDMQTELYRAWTELFDRLLWVPLRNLKRRPGLGYNLSNLFFYEYFCGHPEGDDLAKELWRAIENTNSGRTLFILDGLDEVSELLYEGHEMYPFLTSLLNRPNVITTSRPNASLPPGLRKIDLELETIGFLPAQVHEYIQISFTNLETGEPNQKAVEAVQSFLQKHWLVQGLVRIPIQLDALCYTWDDFNREAMPNTMTGMYKAIVQSLLMKDVIRLEKNIRVVRSAHPPEINRKLDNEMAFLECLAFNGLHSDVIDFTQQHRDKVAQMFDLPLLLDETLGRFSFMRSSEPPSRRENRNYHFLHLTFQEYFAARYFVRQWKDDRPLNYIFHRGLSTSTVPPTDPFSFLREYKYTPRYDILWRFSAGILSAEGRGEEFFQKLHEQPLDLLGPTHQRLIMHCLSEVDPSIKLPIRSSLEANLSEWLRFECDMTGSSQLARESECPDGALRGALDTTSGSRRVGILKSLDSRGRHLSQAAITTLAALLRDSDSKVRSAAAYALGGQSSLSETTIAQVMALFKDSDNNVRDAAGRALSGQSSLSEVTIVELVALLKESDSRVQLAAIQALGGQSSLSEATIAQVVAFVKESDSRVRLAAARALCSQSSLSKANVTKVAVLLKDSDSDSDFRLATARALGGQLSLSEAKVVALLKDNDSKIRLAAIKALCGQSSLSGAIIAQVIALFKDSDSEVLFAAAEVLGGQSSFSDATIAQVISLFKDSPISIRFIIAYALGRQSSLSEATIAQVVALFKDSDSDVRSPAARALGGQSSLSEATIAQVVALFKDSHYDVRSAAAEALGGQSSLSEATIAQVVALFKDSHYDVRSAAAEALGRQSRLPETATTELLALLKDSEGHVRSAAARALRFQKRLPEAVIIELMGLLKDSHSDIRDAAARALGGQSGISEASITELVALLKDSHSDIRSAAAKALGRKSSLPESAVTELVTLLKDGEIHVRCAATRALDGQSGLPETAVTELLALLKDNESHIRSASAKSLFYQSSLLDKILKAIGLLLESERQALTTSSTLRNCYFIEFLYGCLLWRSFNDQISLYIGVCRSSCIINQPSGLRTASFGCNSTRNQFLAAVSKGRHLLNTGGHRVWDTITGDDF